MYSLFNGRPFIDSLIKDFAGVTVTRSSSTEDLGNGIGTVSNEALVNTPDDSLLRPTTHDPMLWVSNASESTEHLIIDPSSAPVTRAASPASMDGLRVPFPKAPVAASSGSLSPATRALMLRLSSSSSSLPSLFVTRSPSPASLSDAQYPPASSSLKLRALCHEALFQMGILVSLAQFTDWHDFYALICTCTSFRHLFGSPDIKDAILSEYVPGYRQGLQERERERCQEIPITIRDLHLLQMSLPISLYEYSAHAQAALTLSAMGSVWSLEEWRRITDKLNALCLAHSRFVLLLQSLVHSSSLPPSPEGSEYGLYSGSFPFGHRELVFPAPLFSDAVTIRSPNVSGSHVRMRTTSTQSNGRMAQRAFADSTSSKRGPKRRLSIFGKKDRVPPPPPSQRIIELYSGSWRRTNPSGYADTKSDRLQRRLSSADSEFSPSRPASIWFSHVPRSQGSPMRSNGSIIPHSPFDVPPPPPFHDLTMALSRTRAPILRVFVPCARISDRSTQECEEQLVQGGLWHNLSTGDLVWNLGYTPSAPTHPEAEQPLGSWLVYNGERLLPFYASEPPPIDDPLLLPSPLYFQHIIPPFTNPHFVLRIPPNGKNVPPPPLALANTVRRVPSTLAATGYAVVKQYVWTAKIRMWSPGLIMDGLGDGWQGAWILETEGTTEGRQKMLDCLYGGVERPWMCEIMRDMSEDGQLWIKLLHPYSDDISPTPPPKRDPRRDSFHPHAPTNITTRPIFPDPGQHLRAITA